MSCEVTSGMTFWYKPAEGFSGGVLEDFSANGFDLTVTVGSPTLSGDPVPGLILGTTDRLLGSTNSSLDFPNGYTIFLVMKETSQVNKIFMGKPGAEDGWDLGKGFSFKHSFNFDNYNNSAFDGPPPHPYFSNFSWNAGLPDFDTGTHVYCVKMFREGDLGSVYYQARQDGVQTNNQQVQGDHEVGPGTMPGPVNNGQFGIGRIYGSGTGLSGTLYEAIGYPSGMLTNADITNIENYLRNKYSIASPLYSYATPAEVGRSAVSNSYEISAPLAADAGDTLVMMTRCRTDGAYTDQIWNWGTQGWHPTTLFSLTPDQSTPAADGSVLVRAFFRTCQGSGESYAFEAVGGQTVPSSPHYIEIVAYSGLACSADGADAGGADLAPYGWHYQAVSLNWNFVNTDPDFQYDRFPDIADQIYAAKPNTMIYECHIGESGLPTITSTVVNEGATGNFSGGGGEQRVVFAFAFDAEETLIGNAPMPDCDPGYRPDCNTINDSAL